jgi:hypothetical protein
MLRTLECSDLTELSFSIRLEENGVLGKRVNFQPVDYHLAYEGPMKARESGNKFPHAKFTAIAVECVDLSQPTNSFLAVTEKIVLQVFL